MADMSLQEWAEKAGIENLRGRLATGDFLLTQANTLLSLLLVGIGGGLAYAVKLAEGSANAPYVWGMTAATAWLSIVAVVLMLRCIVTRKTPALFNEPANLCPSGSTRTLEEVRGFELERIQERIDQAKKRNGIVADWLDRCRYAAIATPVAFTLGAVAAVYR